MVLVRGFTAAPNGPRPTATVLLTQIPAVIGPGEFPAAHAAAAPSPAAGPSSAAAVMIRAPARQVLFMMIFLPRRPGPPPWYGQNSGEVGTAPSVGADPYKPPTRRLRTFLDPMADLVAVAVPGRCAMSG